MDFGDATGAWDASTRDQSAWLWWSFGMIWCKICVDNSLIRMRVEAQGRSKLKRLEVRGESSNWGHHSFRAGTRASGPLAFMLHLFLKRPFHSFFRQSKSEDKDGTHHTDKLSTAAIRCRGPRILCPNSTFAHLSNSRLFSCSNDILSKNRVFLRLPSRHRCQQLVW